MMKKIFISSLVESSIDPLVYQDILKTYAKETISFLDVGHLSITNVDEKTISRAQFTESELSPFHKNELNCDTDKLCAERHASTFQFSEKKILFSDIQHFLIQSFSPGPSGHRPYPSAGGLYPVEPLVFLFRERIESDVDFPTGCYHFRPISKKLQFIKKISTTEFFDKLLHGFMTSKQTPGFCILYMAHLPKAIFKYRYRGYRHALMEAGSMYQQAILVSQQLQLVNTVWSTFSEPEVLYALDLNHATYMPLTMQLFGYGK